MTNSVRDAPRLDDVLAALSSRARRVIVERLATGGPQPVGLVSEGLGLAKASVSKHVKVLEEAGLVARDVRGREHWLGLVPDGFTTTLAWFEHYQTFWSDGLDRLATLVAGLEPQVGPTPDTTPDLTTDSDRSTR